MNFVVRNWVAVVFFSAIAATGLSAMKGLWLCVAIFTVIAAVAAQGVNLCIFGRRLTWTNVSIACLIVALFGFAWRANNLEKKLKETATATYKQVVNAEFGPDGSPKEYWVELKTGERARVIIPRECSTIKVESAPGSDYYRVYNGRDVYGMFQNGPHADFDICATKNSAIKIISQRL